MKTWWLGSAALVLVACKDKEPIDSAAIVDGGIEDVAVEALTMPTAVEVTWTTDEAGTSFVEYGLAGELDRSTEPTAEAVTDHAVTIVLLKGGATYEARAVTILEDGTRVESEPVSFQVGLPPQGMPQITVELIDGAAAQADDGYVLMSTLGAGPSYVGIIDGEGDWVWWAEMDAADLSSARARLSRDGRSVLYNIYQTDRADDQGWIARVSLDGREDVRTRTLVAHHDFVELPDGSFGWLGFDRRTIATVDGEPQVHDVGEGPYPVVTDTILEGPEGLTDADEPTLVWGFYDDYVVGPWWVCDHMEDQGNFVPGYFEWTHANSIAYVDDDDSYYILSRYLDALIKVDRATGETVWQLGGDHATMPLVAGEPFNHGHVSDVWDGGMLMFDNRDHAGAPSRIVEYSWDEGANEAREVWSYDRPDGALLPILGDARKLPSGNRLVAWSARGEMAEITEDGEVVYRATMGLGAIMTRVVWFDREDVAY